MKLHKEFHEIVKNFRSLPLTDEILPARGIFAGKIEDKDKEEFMEVITPNLTRGAAFLVTIVGAKCNALIDTSPTRSCTSEIFYNQLMLPWLLKAFHLAVTSASGSTLLSIGCCTMSV